jgi:hypothetical protein
MNSDPITQEGAIMKNTKIVSKTAKRGIDAGSALVTAEAAHVTKTAWPKKKASLATTKVTDPDLHQTISREAYFRAERRGFVPGLELQDWMEAEKEVLRMRSLDACLDSTKH